MFNAWIIVIAPFIEFAVVYVSKIQAKVLLKFLAINPVSWQGIYMDVVLSDVANTSSLSYKVVSEPWQPYSGKQFVNAFPYRHCKSPPHNKTAINSIFNCYRPIRSWAWDLVFIRMSFLLLYGKDLAPTPAWSLPFHVDSTLQPL